MIKRIENWAARSVICNVILPIPLALSLISGLSKLINLIGGII